MSSDSTQWPLLNERAPFPTGTRERTARRQHRSAWLLTGLAFLCGGLVSAAAFSIGWRHQAQRDNAAQSALAAATARTHRLEQRLGSLRASLVEARRGATAAVAAQQALARAGTRVSADATASSSEAASVSSGTGSLSAAASRIASELKTFDTYLTTTPTGQLDPGYIASQSSYLERQLTRLERNAGSLGSKLTSFEAATRKLNRDAAVLENR